MNDIENLKEEMKKKLTKNEIKKLNKLNLFYRIFDENFTLNNIINIFNLMYHGKYNKTKFNIKNDYYFRIKPIKIVMKRIYINEQKLRNIIFEYIWKKIDYDFTNNVKTLNDYKLIFNIFLKPYYLSRYTPGSYYKITKIYESLEDEFIEASLKINFKEEFLNRFLFLRTMYIGNSNVFEYMYQYTIPFNKKILGFPAKEIKDYLYEKKINKLFGGK